MFTPQRLTYRAENTNASFIQNGAVSTTAPNDGDTLVWVAANNQYEPQAGGGGSGTVTDVSVVSANGFAGTVATSTTTPAITLTTSVTGLLKGNGTAISAAAAGTDYIAPASNASLNTVTVTPLTDLPAGTFRRNSGAQTSYILQAQTELNGFLAGVDASGNYVTTADIGLTGTRVVKGWFTDIESTNMPTVGGTSLSSTFSPIAGSASIVTVGTVTTGVWNAGAVTSSGAVVATTTMATGAAAGTTGLINFNGTTSGTVSLSVADAAGTWTMKLPTSAGTNTYLLQTDGSGNTSWVAPPSGLSWGTAINGGTGTGLALAMDNSYAASGIGQSITIGDTQTQKLIALQIATGSSTADHTGIIVDGVGSLLGRIGMVINYYSAATQAVDNTQGIYLGRQFNTNSAFTYRAIRIDVENNAGASANNGMYLTLNETTAYTAGDAAGVGIYIDKAAATSTAIAVYGQNNVTTANGIVNYTLSNTQSGASVVQKIDTGTSSQGHTGLLVNLANASTSATGVKVDMSTTGRGKAIEIAAGAGMSINIGSQLYSTSPGNEQAFTASFSVNKSLASLDKTVNVFDIQNSRTNTATTGTVADNYSLGYLKRTNVQNGAGGTLTAAGSVLKLENVATQTAGTLTDSVVVLSLIQDNDSTGGHILMNSYTPTTAPTTEGSFYYHGTSKKLEMFTNGIRGWVSKGIYNMADTNTQSGIVTAQSIATDTNAKGTRTLPANFFGSIGKAIKVRINGFYTTDAAPGNATITVKLGSTTIATTGSFGLDSNNTNSPWWIDCILTCRSTGATGTVTMSSGWVHAKDSTTGPLDQQPLITTSPVTVDLTASQVFDVVWTADDAGTVLNTTCFAIWEEF